MATATTTATKWAIDPMHSEINFKVKHLMISTVSGKFADFTGNVESENDDFSDAKINFSAQTASISTGNPQRDGHLITDEFLDSAKFPELTFASKSFTKDGDEYALTGDFTLKGVTKSMTFAVEFNGIQGDFFGNTKAGFELTGKIKRKEFGLTWDGMTEAGGIVLGDEVKIECNIQLAKVV